MFNPEWENLPNFKRLVESKDPHEWYRYADSSNCACAQYLKSENRYRPDWLDSIRGMRELNSLAAGINEKAPCADQWTFGQLLDRINGKLKELENASGAL